jgi:hypothetical protein
LDLHELRVRASPWIALVLGLGWVVVQIGAKRRAVSWNDLSPGFCLIVAGLLLFALLRYLDRPYSEQRRVQDDMTHDDGNDPDEDSL